MTETSSSLACTGCAQKNAASEDWPARQLYCHWSMVFYVIAVFKREETILM